MLRPIEVTQEADGAVLADRRRVEVETGFSNQREIAAEGAQRNAEAALVGRDGNRLATREERGKPDDANEAEGGTVALCVAEASATAWWGFRRGRVESGVCHSVGNLHRVTDSVGVTAPAESL
ncbi:MAG TPA: hypothetical protein VGU66_01560 [Candidatus Elarobacter sp.]|nr:hypothetical protein [Candidatus Elarobacter sp.]